MTVDKETVLRSILSQLESYEMHSVATLLAEQSKIPLDSIQPSNQLEQSLSDRSTIIPEDTTSNDGFENAEPASIPECQSIFTTQHRSPCLVTAFSKDGQFIATGSNDAIIKIVQVQKIHAAAISGKEERPVIKTLYEHESAIRDVQFHPNGRILASCSEDKSISLQDLTARSSSKRNLKMFHDSHEVYSLSFHPSGDFLLAGAENDHVRIYDIHSGQCYIPTDSKTKGHVGTINMVQYGPSGNVFASCGEDGNIVLWDGTTGKLIRTISTAHGGAPVSSISFTKNGKHILSTGLDSVRRLWDVTSGRTVLNYEGASQKSNHLKAVFSQHEDYVIGSDDQDFHVCIWDTKKGTLLKKMPGHSDVIRCISSSPNDGGFVTSSDDFRIKYWNMTR